MGNAVNDAGGNFRSASGIFIGRLRIAFRGLWKNPLITVSAIISIALGIGASTAMFSFYDEFLPRSHRKRCFRRFAASWRGLIPLCRLKTCQQCRGMYTTKHFQRGCQAPWPPRLPAWRRY